jgi:alkylation response protein AidB-like acyl-CoA dehydrogenase
MTRIGALRFPAAVLPPGHRELRLSVQAFLENESFEPRSDAWLSGHDPAFSRRLAEAGFVGMTIPQRYGGRGASWLERYVVVEELLAAGAPVAAHWFGERQIAPLLMRHGTEAQRQRFLPLIARAECLFSIGMSEPDAGSDLAAVRTQGHEEGTGFVVQGQKTWTSHAHRSDFMLVLCRTDDSPGRHAGLSQLLIDLRSPGVEIRPIRLLTGESHFAEVFLEGVAVAGDLLVGVRGEGWSQIIAELAFERSGPERILSVFPLLAELVRELGQDVDERESVVLGQLVARASAALRLSLSVANSLDQGNAPALEAALVKELGTRFEQETVEAVRLATPVEPRLDGPRPLDRSIAGAILTAPGFTLRGGTNEILRGVVARGLLG